MNPEFYLCNVVAYNSMYRLNTFNVVNVYPRLSFGEFRLVYIINNTI